MSIKDKVVVITGSSSGIGKALAIRFAKEGAKVVVNYSSNKRGAEETAEKIKNIGSEVLVVQADVVNEEDIKRLFDTVINKFKTIDILINNAAVNIDKVPYMEATKAYILELLNINLVGAMLCSQHAIKIMNKQGYGKIINTSSIKGIEYGGGSNIVFAATKAAINSFTKTLAKQVAPTIHINAVAPGYVRTRTYDNMSKEKIDAYLNQTFLKRWITEDEIADAFIFLAKNDGITGQIIYVDGGFTLK